MNNQIKELMLEAIRYPRPENIQKVCLPVWNQPFFYKIDKAQALTISYNPTDKGARTNYPEQVARYKKQGFLPEEEIFDILYNFKKENHWRKYYDILFQALGIADENIAHMDVSFFPYVKLEKYFEFAKYDDTVKFLLKTIDLLSSNLEYIFIDGANNRDVLSLLKKDFIFICRESIPINSGKPHDLLIYKHKTRNINLVYYGCFLWGCTCPREEYVKQLAICIASKCGVSTKTQSIQEKADLGKIMIKGALPYGERKGRKPKFDACDQYYITVRLKNSDTKYFLKEFTEGDKILLTGDKRFAQLFEDRRATELCIQLREKYMEYIIGKLPQ